MEEEKEIGKLPNGIFGFECGFVLEYTPENLTLYPEKAGFGMFEIHKSATGGIFVIGFVSQSEQHVLDDPSQTQPFDIHVFCKSYNEFVNPIAIPLSRIISCKDATNRLDIKVTPP